MSKHNPPSFFNELKFFGFITISVIEYPKPSQFRQWLSWSSFSWSDPVRLAHTEDLCHQFSHLVMSDSATPWTVACQESLSITNSQSLLKLMFIKSVIPFNHFIICHPLLPSIFLSIRVFSNEWVLPIRWPKYWSFSFSISASNEYSGMIFFRIDWFDLLAVQETLKSLFQHHNSKASIFQHSAFFIVQISHPYTTTGKTIALTRWIFVGKVMSLLFSMFSMLVIAFLPKSKHLLISWLQSPSAVILEPKKIKSVIVSIVSPSICHEMMGPDLVIFIFWMLTFKPAFSRSSFTFIKRLFSYPLLFVIKMVSTAYLRLLIFLLVILILACVWNHLVLYAVCHIFKKWIMQN